MADHIAGSKAQKIMLVTECSMSDNLRAQFPDRDFQVPCSILILYFHNKTDLFSKFSTLFSVGAKSIIVTCRTG